MLTEVEWQAVYFGSRALREVGAGLTGVGAAELAAESYLSAKTLEALGRRATVANKRPAASRERQCQRARAYTEDAVVQVRLVGLAVFVCVSNSARSLDSCCQKVSMHLFSPNACHLDSGNRSMGGSMSWFTNFLRQVFPNRADATWGAVPSATAAAIVILLGLVGIIAYAAQYTPATVVVSVAGLAALIGLAMFMGGGLMGLVFGIPRSLQEVRSASDQPAYGGNTNLEQISDWLTKILVGVGLTQLRDLPGQVQRLTAYLAPGFGGAASSQVFGLALLIYFTVAGFMIGYLSTRLLLGQALQQADRAALEQRINRIEEITSQRNE